MNKMLCMLFIAMCTTAKIYPFEFSGYIYESSIATMSKWVFSNFSDDCTVIGTYTGKMSGNFFLTHIIGFYSNDTVSYNATLNPGSNSTFEILSRKRFNISDEIGFVVHLLCPEAVNNIHMEAFGIDDDFSELYQWSNVTLIRVSSGENTFALIAILIVFLIL